MKKHSSQTELIKKYLESGKSITPLLALKKFGCFRLGARIWDLKKSGIEVETKLTTNGKKHFAEYSLKKG